MQISFPAIQGSMGNRDYLVTTVKGSVLASLFTFTDFSGISPEERHQRQLNRSRVRAISEYLKENRESYVFGALVSTSRAKPEFKASDLDPRIGVVNVNLEDMKLIWNDGQHRAHGIQEAIKEDPSIGEDDFSVIIFEFESLERNQQIFSDLNRHMVRTPAALNILFDHRDASARIAVQLTKEVPAFVNLTDMEAATLSTKSTKLFTLVSIHTPTEQYFSALGDTSMLPEDKYKSALEFWTYVSENMGEWQDILKGRKTPQDFRKSSVSAHALVLSALGYIGGSVRKSDPLHWKTKLRGIKTMDWNKTNPKFQQIFVFAGSVLTNKTTRAATKQLFRREFDLENLIPEIQIPQPKQSPAQETVTVEAQPTASAPRKRAKKGGRLAKAA